MNKSMLNSPHLTYHYFIKQISTSGNWFTTVNWQMQPLFYRTVKKVDKPIQMDSNYIANYQAKLLIKAKGGDNVATTKEIYVIVSFQLFLHSIALLRLLLPYCMVILVGRMSYESLIS
jgi:hypothetical protein